MAEYNAHETARMQEAHGMPLASFGSRAAALGVDIVVAATLFVIVGLPVEALVLRNWLKIDRPLVFTFFMNMESIVWLVLYFSVFTYLGKGATPGKRLLGIHVVSLVQPRLTLWHSTERALGYVASLLEFGFGFLQYFMHPNRRTVHDRIAETIVVREVGRKRVSTGQSA